MDSITQAVFGAGIQGAMLGKYVGLRKALLGGAVLATLPDLDVLIDYGDPISGMINHRGFSHSVFVLTGFACLLTAIMRRFWPSPHYSAWRLFLTLWLVLITHPLLDAFTAYGTQLFWPLRPTPEAWSSLFIIDPFFTVPLLVAFLVGLVAGYGKRTQAFLVASIAWCGLYLVFAVGAKTVMEDRVRAQLALQGIEPVAVFSTPEPFNIGLWRVIARTADDHYIEAIAGVLDRGPAEMIHLPLNSALATEIGLLPPLEGLQWFSGNWLRYDDIGGQLVVTDLRMGVATGFYSFRFLVAQRTGPGGTWEAVEPSYWPVDRGTSELGRVMQRVISQHPPLPLAAWEQRMTQQPPRAPGRFF